MKKFCVLGDCFRVASMSKSGWVNEGKEWGVWEGKLLTMRVILLGPSAPDGVFGPWAWHSVFGPWAALLTRPVCPAPLPSALLGSRWAYQSPSSRPYCARSSTCNKSAGPGMSPCVCRSCPPASCTCCGPCHTRRSQSPSRRRSARRAPDPHQTRTRRPPPHQTQTRPQRQHQRPAREGPLPLQTPALCRHASACRRACCWPPWRVTR